MLILLLITLCDSYDVELLLQIVNRCQSIVPPVLSNTHGSCILRQFRYKISPMLPPPPPPSFIIIHHHDHHDDDQEEEQELASEIGASGLIKPRHENDNSGGRRHMVIFLMIMILSMMMVMIIWRGWFLVSCCINCKSLSPYLFPTSSRKYWTPPLSGNYSRPMPTSLFFLTRISMHSSTSTGEALFLEIIPLSEVFLHVWLGMYV